MLTLLYRSAAAWTVVGLAGGLFYREFTEKNHHPGGTQLALVHTHSLALGTLFFLVMLALAAGLRGLAEDKRLLQAAWAWNVGMVLTVGTLLVKGSLQVLKSADAESKAISGIAGLGHIIMTIAFVLLFMAVGAAVRRHTASTAVSTDR